MAEIPARVRLLAVSVAAPLRVSVVELSTETMVVFKGMPGPARIIPGVTLAVLVHVTEALPVVVAPLARKVTAPVLSGVVP